MDGEIWEQAGRHGAGVAKLFYKTHSYDTEKKKAQLDSMGFWYFKIHPQQHTLFYYNKPPNHFSKISPTRDQISKHVGLWGAVLTQITLPFLIASSRFNKELDIHQLWGKRINGETE